MGVVGSFAQEEGGELLVGRFGFKFESSFCQNTMLMQDTRHLIIDELTSTHQVCKCLQSRCNQVSLPVYQDMS